MTGLELDREVRRILSTVTRETSLSAAMALDKLGFGAMAAWHMVCLYLDAKEAAAHDDA